MLMSRRTFLCGGDSVAGPFFRSRFRAFSTFSTLIILFSSFARIIIHDMFLSPYQWHEFIQLLLARVSCKFSFTQDMTRLDDSILHPYNHFLACPIFCKHPISLATIWNKPLFDWLEISQMAGGNLSMFYPYTHMNISCRRTDFWGNYNMYR